MLNVILTMRTKTGRRPKSRVKINGSIIEDSHHNVFNVNHINMNHLEQIINVELGIWGRNDSQRILSRIFLAKKY